ncbi:MAG: IclR family transcriptional regulator [Microbacteriaceae bacterium]
MGDLVDTKAPPSISVLGRASDLLSSFRPGESNVSLSELARRTGLPKATAHRLTGELVRLGFLERQGYGLRLGVRLFELGSHAPGPQTLRTSAAPAIMHLSATTRLTVHLGILDGSQVVYIDKRNGGTPLPGLPTAIGSRMPAHATALGKALLAVIRDDLPRDLPRLTPHTVVERRRLEAMLDEVRSRGLAFDRQEARIGFECVASVIYGRCGEPIGALSLCGPVGSFDADAQAGAVLTAAASVSAGLPRRSA